MSVNYNDTGTSEQREPTSFPAGVALPAVSKAENRCGSMGLSTADEVFHGWDGGTLQRTSTTCEVVRPFSTTTARSFDVTWFFSTNVWFPTGTSKDRSGVVPTLRPFQ